MSNKKTMLAGGISAALAITGASGALAQVPAEAPAAPATPVAAVAVSPVTFSATVAADAAAGVFAFDQATITPNAQIATAFRGATAALCSATDDFVVANPLEWKLAVTGDVDNAFVAPVDELASESAVKQTMTCTCGGNPADGKAIINAEVKGIPVTYLLDRARAQAGVNTVTFVASDGTQVALPLAFVVGHHAVISYEVNGEDLSASMGGNNQLWMTGTSANFFVRDIVEVRVTAEANPPANPGDGMDYPNSPNVGILAAQIA